MALSTPVSGTPALDLEAHLVRRAAAGDDAAFEGLYRRHVARIHSLVRRMTDAGMADEVTQDVFVRAWTKLASFRGESAFGTWLYRLAVNVVLTRRRSERTERDDAARQVLQELFPTRRVVVIDCTALVWGLGAFHCVTQQWPETEGGGRNDRGLRNA